jgi:hypothetical protein
MAKQAKKESGYQGWTNYETWCVALWLDNDESLYNWVREAAQEAVQDAKDNPSQYLKPRENRIYLLSERIKSAVEEWTPELEGMWSDLMSAALSEVEWREIAEAQLEALS